MTLTKRGPETRQVVEFDGYPEEAWLIDMWLRCQGCDHLLLLHEHAVCLLDSCDCEDGR